MRINDLRTLTEMTYSDAVRVFTSNGVPERVLGLPDGLKKAHRKLAMSNHPDRGGDSEMMKKINAAYDVLKSGSGQVRATQNTRYEPQETPEWAMAGYSGGMKPNGHIFRNDYTDMNFIKKRMWELSGKSREEWTIWGFDGRYNRNVVTVFGSSKVFPEMAKAMVMWQTKGGNSYPITAVLVTRKSEPNAMYLIWADGKDVKPVRIQHDSFNANPFNDPNMSSEVNRAIAGLNGNNRGSNLDIKV